MGIYAYSVVGMEGDSIPLSTYRNMVVLIVNTATRCGFTPHYEGLETLYEQYGRSGFTVLDFPCNQFKEQAPEEIAEIDAFCKLNYGTKFPRFAKLDVNGEKQSPLFAFLKSEKGFAGFDPDHEKTPNLIKRLQAADPAYEQDPSIKWNFTKFLIDRRGSVIARFEPTASFASIAQAIEELL
ncbi:MAG: glutathione peroxidase [Spirochaetia bacterium]|nr:glutathione peroxidase [Spirochaetia bacterium]